MNANQTKLLKKIDQAKIFLKHNRRLFKCLYCNAEMTAIEDNSFICDQGHRFDLSKKGTLFLIKHGVKSDYDRKQLWQARRHVLQHGLFDKVLEQIIYRMPQRNLTYIDVGCGEGTPLARIRAQRSQFKDQVIGFDISKDAINLATQQNSNSFFCIADLAALPFADHQIDVIIDILSPSSYREFDRVLAHDGILFKVIPNAEYLIELRHRLYRSDDPRYSYQNNDVLNRVLEQYPQTEVVPVKYQFDLTSSLATDLLKMTPLQWGTQADAVNVFKTPLDYVTVDMSLLIVRKNL